MKKIFVTVLLGLTGLVLLIVVGLGIFLATFDPNAYKSQLSAAVEKATGRSVQFQSDLEVSLFPTLGFKTGRVAMIDPDIFGGEIFLSVESASFQVSLRSLLDRIVEVEEVALHGVRLNLVTNAVGQHNWEFTDRRDAGTETDAGTTPLQDQGAGQGGRPGAFALKIQEIRLTDTRVSYRDMQTGTAYSGRLDPFTLHNLLHPDAVIPIALSGTASNDNGKERIRFDLRGELRLASTDDGPDSDAGGMVSLEMQRFDIQGEGFDIGLFRLLGEAVFRYDLNEGVFTVSGLQGSVSLPSADGVESRGLRTEYTGGRLTFVPAKGTQAARVEGGIALTELNVDMLQRRLSSAASAGAVSADDSVSGAPNLSRPTVPTADKPKLDPQLAREIQELDAAKAERDAQAGATQAAEKTGMQWIDGKFVVTVERVIAQGLPIRDLRLEALSEKETVTLPFSMSLFKGAITGTAKASMVKEDFSLSLSGEVKGLDVAEATNTLSGKYTVTGLLNASCALTGKGGDAAVILNSLSGTISAQVGSGEVRGFSLIPVDLPGLGTIPVNFPFESLSASARVERGVAQSRDISLQSRVLVGRGGGKIFLAYVQADLGLEFLLGGLPPAIPVNISGPVASLSYSVDMRTFMRNAAESAAGALPSPDAARDLLRNVRDIGSRILR